MKPVPYLGTGFIVNNKICNSIISFSSPKWENVYWKHSNKVYTMINFHASTNDSNRNDIEIVEFFWSELEDLETPHYYHNGGTTTPRLERSKESRTQLENPSSGVFRQKRPNRNGKRLMYAEITSYSLIHSFQPTSQ